MSVAKTLPGGLTLEHIERTLTRACGSDNHAARIRRLLAHAGLENVSALDLAGDAQTGWFTAIEAASRAGKLEDVVKAAARDLPGDEDLRALVHAFDDRVDTEQALLAALRSPDLRPPTLRRRGHLDDMAISRLDDAIERIVDLAEAASGSTIVERARDCMDALQLYAELLEQDLARTRPRRLGEPVATRPLGEVALDRQTLLDAKRQLADSLAGLRSAS